jgi:hypothetical protein
MKKTLLVLLALVLAVSLMGLAVVKVKAASPVADITYTDTFDGSHCHLVLTPSGSDLLLHQVCTNLYTWTPPVNDTFTSDATLPGANGTLTNPDGLGYFGNHGSVDGWIGNIFSFSTTGYWQNVSTKDIETTCNGGFYELDTFIANDNGADPTITWKGVWSSLTVVGKCTPAAKFIANPEGWVYWVVPAADGGPSCNFWISDGGQPSATNEAYVINGNPICRAGFVGLSGAHNYIFGTIGGNPIFQDGWTLNLISLPNRPPDW